VELQEVITPNYRLCCHDVLPATTFVPRCVSDGPAVSSCSDLLVSFYQAALICLSLVAVLANAASLPVRLVLHKESLHNPFSLLVTNLNAANLLTGVYCGVIAGVDQLFRGRYVHSETAWRHRSSCSAAGFLYVLSTEVSALTIALITWDRVSDLCFPAHGPHSGWRLSNKSALAACVLTWAAGLLVSTLALFSPSSGAPHSGSGLCVPMPASVLADQGGSLYSIVIHASLRPVTCCLVVAGQYWLYWAARGGRETGLLKETPQGRGPSHSAHTDPSRFTRQFTSVALTDAACWAVVSGVSLWSLVTRVAVGDDVNAFLAVCLQTVNAALNPCLYMANKALEDRRVERHATLLRRLRLRLPHGRS
jgi:hypothetical protein